MNTTRKIYIGSRQGQGTGSDFTLTLKQSVQCPENTVAFVDEIIVPKTFPTVDQNRCYIYIREEFQTVVTERRIQLDVGNYAGPALAANRQANEDWLGHHWLTVLCGL